MKKRHLKAASLIMAAALMTTSCVGSFQLTHRLAQWNKSATKERFLNEIIFLLISPAYPVCAVADALVLNTMEFWSGSNPLADRVGTKRTVLGQDGRYYAVTTKRYGYEVKTPEGETIRFAYDKKTDSWSQQQRGKKTEIFRFNPDGTIQASLLDGRTIRVTPDAAGLFETRMAMHGADLSMGY